MLEDKYLKINTKLNNDTFDKTEFFNLVEDIIKHLNIDIDDFKGNISTRELDICDSFYIKCDFSWIIYESNVPKKDFKNLKSKIEKIITDAFDPNLIKDCECAIIDRLSDYVDKENKGHDVILVFNIDYYLDRRS